MVNLCYTQTKDGFIVAIDTDRIQTGMDSDPNDAMAPHEMYLMLQADMITIKEQEQVFQSELDEVSSKFRHLLEACGIDSDGGSGTMAPPSTPSLMKTGSPSLTQVTNIDNMETPTFLKQTPSKSTFLNLSDSSDDDADRSLFPSNFEMDSIAVVNSCDGLPLDISNLSSKTLLVDRNSNYLESPHSEVTDNTPIIEAIPSLDKTSPSTTNTSSSSGGSSSHRMSSSSDGYPKSDDSSDNQVVPECYDLDREFMSRLQYYSDFTLDRQRKINTMASHLGSGPNDKSSSSVTEDLFTRHVEGKESSPEKPFVKPNLVYPAASLSSSGSHVSTPPSRHYSSLPRDRSHRPRSSRSSRRTSSRPLASSTMIEDSFSSSSSGHGSNRGHTHSLIPIAMSTLISESESSSGSGRRNRTGGSNPQACSTMLNETFLSSGSYGSGSSRHRSSSIPMANSTMISDVPDIVSRIAEPTGAESRLQPGSNVIMNHYSDNDCESVYTWSIHDDDGESDHDISLEESYMKKITQSQKKASCKPPLPPARHVRNGSDASRDSDSENVCQDHRLHVLLGERCSKDILESISGIEPNDTCRASALFVESLCDDATMIGAVPKTNSIPRSSTRLKLQDKSSGSSSMDAKCASLPDLTAVSNTNGTRSVPDSLTSGSDENPLPERLACQGKSSSSNDNPSHSASANEPSSQFSQGSANIDSILTDSPNSVCSGINAPYNSPGTNISSSSRVSCSTTSDAKSSDSNINSRAPRVTLMPRNIPMPSPSKSPKLQNVDVRKSKSPGGSVFKIPRQNMPLRNLLRFRRKSKTPDPKTSTPNDAARAGPSDRPTSKRQLFPSSGTSNLQQEVKIMDKKAVIKKFKKFSDNFGKKDKAGRPKIETLANL